MTTEAIANSARAAGIPASTMAALMLAALTVSVGCTGRYSIRSLSEGPIPCYAMEEQIDFV